MKTPARSPASRPPARDRERALFVAGLVVVFVVAIGLRVEHLVAMATPDNPIHNPAVFDMDTQRIHEQALAILAAGPFPDKPFPHAPGFCYTVAAVYAVFGPQSYALVYLVNALMGALTALVVALLGRRLFGPRTGLAAGLLTAAYGPLLFHSAFMLGDVQGAFLATLALSELLGLIDRPGWTRAVRLGLVLGAAALTRPNALLLAVPVTGLVLTRATAVSPGRRFALLCVTGGLTALLIAHPTYTASRSQGRLEVICPTMEFNFIWANSATSTGWGCAYPAKGTPTLPLLSLARLRHELRKASYIWRFFEFPCNTNYYLYGALSWPIDWNPLTWRLVGPFALLGMGLALRRGVAAPALHWVLWCWIPLNLTFVLGRLRLVMMPVLMLFAASAAGWLWHRARRSPDRGLAGALAALAAAAVFVNAQDPSYYHGVYYADSTYGNARMIRANKLRDEGAAHVANKHPAAAATLARAEEQARAMLPVATAAYHIVGYLTLADIARYRGDAPAANAYQARAAEIQAKVERLPAADHAGTKFTPPTYRFWPGPLAPDDLAWLDRELAIAPRTSASANRAVE